MDERLEFREAVQGDIEKLMSIRFAVKENALNNRSLVTEQICRDFIFNRGKGWVCELNDEVLGFAIADLKDENIWALFVHPEHEGKGIGKALHQIMMDWYFDQGKKWVWLGTAPHTRAEQFYQNRGWSAKGQQPNGETRFEMTAEDWHKFQDES